MLNKTKQEYSIIIHHVVGESEDEEYYFAYLPDFGHSACSACGNTPEEAIELLELVERDMIAYYNETGKEVPKPTIPSFLL